MVPAAEAIRGQISAHSFATGPAIAEPFISPFGFTITPASQPVQHAVLGASIMIDHTGTPRGIGAPAQH